MPNIKYTSVHDLEKSILVSGYSMRSAEMPQGERDTAIWTIREVIGTYTSKRDKNALRANKDVLRAIRLAQAKTGGEDQFLTGITVSFDLTISIKCWVQVERYKFMNFVSSYSLMHRIGKMDLVEGSNKYVYGNSHHLLMILKDRYEEALESGDKDRIKEAKLELLYNVPTGFELTAGMTTNYRCLKNIYKQRRHHLLPDWQYICDWIETLPLAEFLITGQEDINDRGQEDINVDG